VKKGSSCLKLEFLSRHRISLALKAWEVLKILDAEVMILPLGFYAAEWNGLGGDTMFVSCGDEDHN